MSESTKKPDDLFLIDGSGYIFRAFHALPPLTRADGTPVNAVLGFTNMLLKLIADAEAEYLVVLFDTARATFRNDIYPQYKAHRPPPPPELVPQFSLIRDATRACNVPQLEMAGFEADDLIATYARQAVAAGLNVTIVSSDKDLMQLVGPQVKMLDPIKNRPIGPAEVEEKFGVGPELVVEVQALCGDSSDNVPGVPGIGVKTAAELIKTFGSLDALLERAGEIKQPKRRETLIANAELARISRELVRLKADVAVPEPYTAFARRDPEAETLLPFLRENQFRSLLAKAEGRFQSGAGMAGDRTANGGGGAGGARTAGAGAPAARAASAQDNIPTRYDLVMDLATLEDWIARAEAAGVVAFDTETTSLDANLAELVGFSLAVEPGHAAYVPLGHRAPAAAMELDLGDGGAKPEKGKKKSASGNGAANGKGPLLPGQIPVAAALAALRPLLEDESVLKIGQNIKYDMVVLAQHGIGIAPIEDSMLISYVLEGGKHGHGMDELAKLHLGQDTIKFEDVCGSGKSQIGFAEVPLEKARDYAAEDAEVTLRLQSALRPMLLAERMTTVYETIERPLVPVVAAMEAAGVKVDRKVLAELSADFAGRIAALEKQIHKLAGREFNIGSPKQLGEILFDEMGLEGGTRGKTGAYATGADVLEELAAMGHDLPARVLDWRQLSKLKSTYTDALQEQINPRTGRVHTCFALAATSTGRLSSTDPNLQNIPIRTEEGRKIRRAFVAEPGMTLLSVDYSQIELRLAAHIAEIPALAEAFRKGQDIHALTASQVFGVPVEGMDPMIRRRAKAINFGIIYGISPFGLAAQLGIPQGEARAYIDAYFKRYPGIREYMERTKKVAREQGYVTTLFGRRCHVPGIADKNPARRSFMERAAINAPLQGTAADIIKRAMIRVPAALAEAGLKARMLLQVHDELLFEVPAKEAEATAALVKKVMEGASAPALTLSVPLVAETGVGKNWAEAH
jgi:DNA polymerase-1